MISRKLLIEIITSLGSLIIYASTLCKDRVKFEAFYIDFKMYLMLLKIVQIMNY